MIAVVVTLIAITAVQGIALAVVAHRVNVLSDRVRLMRAWQTAHITSRDEPKVQAFFQSPPFDIRDLP